MKGFFQQDHCKSIGDPVLGLLHKIRPWGPLEGLLPPFTNQTAGWRLLEEKEQNRNVCITDKGPLACM